MNRKIQFRVWDGDEMIYLQPTGIQKFAFENGDVMSFSDEGYKEFYSHECYPSVKCEYPVMQFTGLKDKNGKEIYEGDICKWPSNHLSKIEWNNKRACFNAVGITQSRGVSRGGIVPTHIEVIGNIYQHPELLNQK